ncbi:DUF983 domain-containing protein [uncultured Fluviicola sp.]|uniref:DUF983 domain-containing protein n=1 Tax=uncultured Fluviicola sp. TaxID=463303 RepID=UPI0025E7358F|nr:DUF983 domain-containing protein [uncultured Fluviicola sp.]
MSFAHRLKSIFQMKCPQCREGDFFVSKPYDMKNLGKTHEHCSKCGLKYEKEIGFYYGAMYVSYALGVALFVTCWVSFNLFFPQANIWLQIGIISGLSIILSPYFYALSKVIWANLFFSYDPEAIEKFKKGSKS